jgi:cellulose synthase/poly-beta-1,6-N-acetylglucosamine synthase-like glycosyltransferase
MAAHMMNNKLEYRVGYIPLSCCWTEGPPNIQILGRQRTRWASGLFQVFSDHRKILFNPSYKRLGLITFPYIFIFEFLAPIIEAVGILFTIFLVLFGYVNWNFAPLILLYSYTFAIMISSVVIIWDQMTFKYYNTSREVLSLFLTAFIEPILYHPLIVFFSLKGYFSYITSRELAWGTMTRQGFDNENKKKKDDPNDNGTKNGTDAKDKKPSIFERLKRRKKSTKLDTIKT